jgi:hypothetical protein
MSDFLPSEIINHINSFCDNRTQYSIQHTCTKFYDRDILRKIKLGLIHNLAHQLCYRNRLALSRLGKRPLYNIINLNIHILLFNYVIRIMVSFLIDVMIHIQ